MASNQVEFYSNEIIQRKLEEYCSPFPRPWPGSPADHIVNSSAQYWVGYGESLLWDGSRRPFASIHKSYEGFYWAMEKGLDFFRSVWDNECTIINIDIEYYNLDYPGYSYIFPVRSLMLVERVWKQLRKILEWGFGITPLVFQTGNGVQMTFAVARDSYADRLFQAAGTLDWTVESKYRYRIDGMRPYGLPVSQGLSFDGTGKLVEYLFHKTVFELRSEGFDFPVNIGDITSISSKGIKEGVNFDTSLYYDPLYMRDTRAPFSTHQKHKVSRTKVGEDVALSVPVQIAVPRLVRGLDGQFFEVDFDTVVGRFQGSNDGGLRRHFDGAAELAWACNCRIPVYDFEPIPLFHEYHGSILRRFHEDFDEVVHEPYWAGETWYDHVDWEDFPPCIAEPLRQMDPVCLLNPNYIRLITRILMARGIHPKHVGGILAMKYAQIDNWERYDQSTRANGWVRAYSGQIMTKLDLLEDFDCLSLQKRGMCRCDGRICHNLLDYRRDLEHVRDRWLYGE
jgi:hypothetical protein